MNALRKNYSAFISSVLLAVFISLLAVETSHHHGALEDNDNCSMCAWQMTGSQAIAAPTPPVLLPLILVTALFFFFPCLQFFKQIQSRGRSPPLLPL
jgi:hypothetical protein